MTPYEQGYYNVLEKIAGWREVVQFMRKGPVPGGKGFLGHTQLSKTLTDPVHRSAAAEMLYNARRARGVARRSWLDPVLNKPWGEAAGKAHTARGSLPQATQQELMKLPSML